MSPNGQIYEEAPYFEEWYKVFELEDIIAAKQNIEQTQHKIQEIHDALVLGVKDYFGKLGFKKAILGLSGGIDSAVTAAIAMLLPRTLDANMISYRLKESMMDS